MTLLLVILGAAIGAPLRYVTDRAIQARHGTDFPWGTFTVNVVASVVLGLVSGAVAAGGVSPDVQALAGTGLCGALSTYSTFSYENMRLIEMGSRVVAAANILASVVVGVGAAFVGWELAQAIWS